MSPPAPGHVYPNLPLIEQLVSRGHRVSYVTSPRLGKVVAAAGATPVELNWDEDTSSLTEFSLDTLMTTLESYLAAVRPALPELLAGFRSDPPDAVCADAVILGPLLSAALNVPTVSVVPNFVGNEHWSADELVPGFDPANSRFAAYGAEVGRLFGEYGLTMPPDPELVLVYLPREFQIAGETFDDHYRFIGPSISRSRDIGWRPPTGIAPILLVSLGTAFNNRPEFFAQCVAAFRGTRWHVVISVGEHVDRASIGSAAPNVDVVASVPQVAVLRRACAFITHAGMGSVMEALYHGVPMLTVPQAHEQSLNAGRVADLGLGRPLDLAGDLRQQVEDLVSDKAIHTSLSAMRTAIHAAGGATAGADAVERYLDDRAPVEPSPA